MTVLENEKKGPGTITTTQFSFKTMSAVVLAPAPSAQNREQALYLAKLVEQAERYEVRLACSLA